MRASVKAIIILLFIGLGVAFIYQGSFSETDLGADHEEGASSVTLTQINTPLTIMGNRLYCGGLVIELPDGVTADMDRGPEAEQVSLVIDLEGVEDIPLAARLWVTFYRADSLNKWALLSALLDLLPETAPQVRDYDPDANTALLTYTSGYKKGYIMLYEEDVCIVEEMLYGGRYVFGELLDDHAVRWDDLYECGDRNNNNDIVLLDKLETGKDSFLTVRYTSEDGRRWLELIQVGDDTESYQDIEGGCGTICQKIEIEPITSASREWLKYKDYNFDGHVDINVSSDTIYLWDSDRRQYVEAQVPEEFLWLDSDAYYADTEVIWGYECNYAESGNGDSYDEIETLWKWVGNTLVKKRECKARISVETVWLCAYESSTGSKMFDQSVTLEEYQECSARVKKLYGQFYDEMAPAETFARAHNIDSNKEESTYIPQEFLDIITEAMRAGTELETLKPMVNDRELSDEEILSIAKDNIDLRQMVLDKDWTNAYLMVMADGDNDGIMDIIARESYGGSDGSVDYVFYQGQENGTFQRTDALPSVREEFGVLEYDGRNYLFRTLFDYEKKIYNGIGITCYVDGKCVEQAVLMLEPEHYETTLAECTQEAYRRYAQQVAAESLTYKEVFAEEGNMSGSSEEKLPDYGEYQCDLDNDGTVDQYEKILFDTCNINVCNYLQFDGEGRAAEAVKDALASLEGTPVMMWVDAVQGKNVINVMSQTGLEDIAITGFLVSGSAYERLYDIRVDVTYGVSVSGLAAGG
ncbi:MAG: hypothetical protein K2N95_00870 [Lachnospiraceae bacterium]|nr:hypothetical protein [Lachnospiraceae bacterium]